ncbi:hypothetical protein [Tellurirhabdus bombi]|uniref:hypothetical protein n=1 Tax=Tellurirhabdus bombi TaxID=2907205 RepID=UPI001F3AB172|nr:hypothetical protein [Tellurirhabdus bombi]
MRKLIAVLLAFTSVTAIAQSPVSSRLVSGADLGASFATKKLSPSIAYYQLLNLDERKIFQFGWHTKLQNYYGQESVDYYTAPARLTRGKTGFGALSAPLIPENIDTLTMPRASFISLNLGLRFQIHLGPVELGAATDILGVGLGKGRLGLYRAIKGANSVDSLNLHQTNKYAQPQRFNLRLLGDNNMGFLSSEVYARILFSRRVAFKVGYQWITTEYRTNDELVDDNRRFRRNYAMPYVALSFPFF